MKYPGMKSNRLTQKIRKLMLDFLTLNKTEQRGTIILTLLLLALTIYRALLPFAGNVGNTSYETLSADVLAFEAAWKKASDSDSIARAERNFLPLLPGNSKRDTLAGPHFLKKELIVVELNTADTLDLQQLKGIGPGYARRIISWREKLGGFYDKRQLLEVYGMDTLRFRWIATHVSTDPQYIKKLNINVVTLKELIRHPYFPFPLAKKIVLHRHQKGPYQSVDELKEAVGLTDSLFRRMIPYLNL